MNVVTLDTGAVLDKLVIPILGALTAWFVKDVLVGSYVARREEARKEWLFRLREVYSPLFMWSGVVLFQGKQGTHKFGVTQFAEVLSRAANLLPIREYFVFVRLLEQATGQTTTAPSLLDLQKARNYVYSRIELLNAALFAQHSYFEPTRQTDLFSSIRAVTKIGLDAIIPVTIWLALTVIVMLVYRLVAGNLIAITLICALLLLILAEEIIRRFQWHKEIDRRLKS
jgi:hypothetical protein